MFVIKTHKKLISIILIILLLAGVLLFSLNNKRNNTSSGQKEINEQEVVKDITAPSLKVTAEVKNYYLFENPLLTLESEVGARLMVNGEKKDEFKASSLTITPSLVQGKNTLELVVVDASGNESEPKKLEINFFNKPTHKVFKCTDFEFPYDAQILQIGLLPPSENIFMGGYSFEDVDGVDCSEDWVSIEFVKVGKRLQCVACGGNVLDSDVLFRTAYDFSTQKVMNSQEYISDRLKTYDKIEYKNINQKEYTNYSGIKGILLVYDVDQNYDGEYITSHHPPEKTKRIEFIFDHNGRAFVISSEKIKFNQSEITQVMDIISGLRISK